MSYEPKPEHRFTFGLWTVGNLGRDPFGEPVREPLPPSPQICDLLGEVGRVRRQLPRQRPDPHRRHAHEADQIVRDFSKALEGQRPRRADGDDEPVQRPGLQGRRVHQQQRRRPRLRDPEDDAGDGPRRGVRREDLRLLGRPRGRRDRRHQEPGRGDQALPRGDQLPVRVHARPEVTATSSRSKPSPTSRAATCTSRRPARTSRFIPTLDHPEMWA